MISRNPLLVWHDRFRTNVLVQTATFDLVAGDTQVVDPFPFRYSRLVDGTKLVATKWN